MPASVSSPSSADQPLQAGLQSFDGSVHLAPSDDWADGIPAKAPPVYVGFGSMPKIVDQPYWAGRVAEMGIGAAHDGPAPTLGSLSAALRTGLTLGPGHEGGR